MESQTEETKDSKQKHPGWKKMIAIAIKSMNDGTASKSEIQNYIQVNYPSTQYKISKGSAFQSTLTNNLKKFKYDEQTKQYRVSEKKCNKKVSQRKGSAPKPPRRTHAQALGPYKCCELKAHVIKLQHMDELRNILKISCTKRKETIEQWNNELKAMMKGKILIKKLIEILTLYVGYNKDVVEEEALKIMNKYDVDKDGRISFEDLLPATPGMHRFYVYHKVMPGELCKRGYIWYKDSHPLPGIFKKEANAYIPNDMYQ
eukprot:476737_1